MERNLCVAAPAALLQRPNIQKHRRQFQRINRNSPSSRVCIPRAQSQNPGSHANAGEEASRALHRRQLLYAAPLALSLSQLALPQIPAQAAGEKSLYDFTVTQYDKPFALDAFRGKVTVVVNVASE